MEAPDHVVFWKVRCLNRQRKNFFDRFLILDQPNMSGEERDRFFGMLESGGRTKDYVFLEFRSRFVEIKPRDFKRIATEGKKITCGGPAEYFEDEKGNPLDRIGVAQILTGDPNPILLFEPRSVLRLGPSPIRGREDWTVEKADTISHFLQLMNRIRESGWFRGRLSLRSIGGSFDQVIHPNAELTTTALTYIRQMLLKRDDVLNEACNAYIDHISHQGRRIWVQDIHQSFNEYLDSPCEHGWQSILSGYTARQVIDIFTYGLGLFHRASNDDCESEMARLIAQHGREQLIFAFNSTCRDLLQYGLFLRPVMSQDFSHWITVEGCQGPDRPQISHLFGS